MDDAAVHCMVTLHCNKSQPTAEQENMCDDNQAPQQPDARGEPALPMGSSEEDQLLQLAGMVGSEPQSAAPAQGSPVAPCEQPYHMEHDQQEQQSWQQGQTLQPLQLQQPAAEPPPAPAAQAQQLQLSAHAPVAAAQQVAILQRPPAPAPAEGVPAVVPVAAGARARVPAWADVPARPVTVAAEQVVEDLAGLQRFPAPAEPHVSYLLRFHHMVHKEMDGG